MNTSLNGKLVFLTYDTPFPSMSDTYKIFFCDTYKSLKLFLPKNMYKMEYVLLPFWQKLDVLGFILLF